MCVKLYIWLLTQIYLLLWILLLLLIFRNPVSSIRQLEKRSEIAPPNLQAKSDDETDTASELQLHDQPHKPISVLQKSLITSRMPDNIAGGAGEAYSSVVQELKTITKKVESESDESAVEMVAKIAKQRMSIFQSKSALKSQPLPSVMRKKVLFDLESEKKSASEKPQILPRKNEGGSTTSIASSVFDGSKAHVLDVQKLEAKEQEKRNDSDISDWDISEALN